MKKKAKEIKNLNKIDTEKKLKELQIELIKSKVDNSKKGNVKTSEIKKMIARIYTLKK